MLGHPLEHKSYSDNVQKSASTDGLLLGPTYVLYIPLLTSTFGKYDRGWMLTVLYSDLQLPLYTLQILLLARVGMGRGYTEAYMH